MGINKKEHLKKANGYFSAFTYAAYDSFYAAGTSLHAAKEIVVDTYKNADSIISILGTIVVISGICAMLPATAPFSYILLNNPLTILAAVTAYSNYDKIGEFASNGYEASHKALEASADLTLATVEGAQFVALELGIYSETTHEVIGHILPVESY